MNLSLSPLVSLEVQCVLRLAIEMKQDIEAKMKDKTSGGWVGYRGLYFCYSPEGHLHVLLSQQGVCLQKRHADVINPTAAHGIVPQHLKLYSTQNLSFLLSNAS